jgi:hypothetical protein
VWGRVEVNTGVYVENLREEEHSEVLDVDGKIISKWILEKLGGITWTGFI